MEIRQLRYVVAVARTMNFTQAAAALGIAQPALSQAVAQFERQLGISLFDRNSRRVELTAAGRLFVERAEKILNDLDNLQHNMLDHAEVLHGKVNVGTMVFFFFGSIPLAAILAAFALRHPGVELNIENNTVEVNLAGLRLGKIDVALINVAEHVEYPELGFTTVGSDDVLAILPPGHPLSARAHIRLSELRDDPFVTYRAGSTMHEAMNILLQEAKFTPRVAARSGNIILVRSLVSAGLGASIGPKSYLMSPGPPVAAVPIRPHHTISITMATRPNVNTNPAARALVEFMHEWLDAETVRRAAATA